MTPPTSETPLPTCRLCSAALNNLVVDLGEHPPANAYLEPGSPASAECRYPLRLFVCDRCWLVQLGESPPPEQIFTADYAYHSSYSTSWVAHAKAYVEEVVPALGLGADSLVVEIASNDGYLLQHFSAHGVPVLGLEPATGAAVEARERGVPTIEEFFGSTFASRFVQDQRRADLVIANNVLAHVPRLDDLIEGVATLLEPDGTFTAEFPHLLRMLESREFDTIYHEHYSYLSLRVIQRALAEHGLEAVSVRELPTHGGSLRVTARHAGAGAVDPSVAAVTAAEEAAGLETLDAYAHFEADVDAVRRDLVDFVQDARAQGKRVVGYGAPAKGNTLLNSCGMTRSHIEFTADLSPLKQGKELPGSRIPIRSPDDLLAARPDYVLILPWNLEAEITEQLAEIRSWGGRFVVPIPRLRVI